MITESELISIAGLIRILTEASGNTTTVALGDVPVIDSNGEVIGVLKSGEHGATEWAFYAARETG